MFGFSLFRTYAGRPSRFQIFSLKGAAAAEVNLVNISGTFSRIDFLV